jgi:hypothetical protein
MEISATPTPTSQYQRDAATTKIAAEAAPAVKTSMTTAAGGAQQSSQFDKSQLLNVPMVEKSAPTEAQTLKPYGVIMLPFREDDTAMALKA